MTIASMAKHETYRFGLVAAMAVAYTNIYLGRPISTRALQSAGLMAASSVAAEFATRNILGSVTSSGGIKAPVFMAAEAAGTGIAFASLYPRVIGGRSPGFQSLATTAALIDGAAQIAGPRIAKVIEGDRDAYTTY